MKGLVDGRLVYRGPSTAAPCSSASRSTWRIFGCLFSRRSHKATAAPTPTICFGKARWSAFAFAQAAEKSWLRAEKRTCALNVIEQLHGSRGRVERRSQRQASLQRMARREWETAATAES